MTANMQRRSEVYETGESPHRGEPHGCRWAEARARSNVTRLVILIRDSNAARLFVGYVGPRAAPSALFCDFHYPTRSLQNGVLCSIATSRSYANS